jgi:hypothetical protein
MVKRNNKRGFPAILGGFILVCHEGSILNEDIEAAALALEFVAKALDGVEIGEVDDPQLRLPVARLGFEL